MPGSTDVNSLPFPVGGDAADIEQAVEPLASAVDTLVIPRYSDTSSRNTAYAGNTDEGQLTYIQGTVHEYQRFDGTNWVQMFPYTQFKYVDAAISETRTSTTTKTDSTYIQFSVVTNAIYILHFDFICEGGAGGASFAWAYPTGSEHNWGGVVPTSVGAGDPVGDVNYTYYDREAGTLSSGLGFLSLLASGGDAMHFRGDGLLRTGGTAGTYKLQWAQNSSNGATSHLIRNSWATLTRMA